MPHSRPDLSEGGSGGGSQGGEPLDDTQSSIVDAKKEKHEEATLAAEFANYYQGIPSGTLGGLLPNEDSTGLPIVKRIKL